MRHIDELDLEYPFAGGHTRQRLLIAGGYGVGFLHVVTLMKRMGIEALYRKPNTSKPEPWQRIDSHLLLKLPVTHPNQLWAMDITCIPMARGFVYLTAVVDWYSLEILSSRLSTTMDVGFCIEALEEAMARYGRLDNFKTDEGSLFTSTAFIGMLSANGIEIGMDGKGA